MTQFISRTLPWPIDVVQHHNSHLTENIRNQAKSNGYIYNPVSASRLPWDQTKDLGLAYKAASQAEQDINLRKDEITDQLRSNHALITSIGVYQSQAEGTLKKYTPRECWGCGAKDHFFADKKGNIICPKKDDPEVAKQAAAKRAEYVSRAQARYKRRNDCSNDCGDKCKISSLLTGFSEDKIKTMVAKQQKKT